MNAKQAYEIALCSQDAQTAYIFDSIKETAKKAVFNFQFIQKN